MRLSEMHGIVYGLKPGDHQAGAVGDSILMESYRTVAFLIAFAAITGDAVLSIYSGASDGTKTTQETFNYRLADAAQAAAGADGYGNWATSTALTLTAATYQNKILLVEVDAQALTDGQPWVTLDLDAAASALNAAVVAILSGARYQAHDMPGALA